MKTIVRCSLKKGLAAFLGFLLVAGAGARAAEGEAPKPKPEASAVTLLQQLESNDFDERREAEARLEELGESARSALEAAAKDAEDLETRETARRLLSKLNVSTLRIFVVDRTGKPQKGLALNLTATMQQAYSDPSQPQYRQDQEKKEATTDAKGQAEVTELKPLGAYLNFDALKDHFFVSGYSGYGRSQPSFQANVKLRSGVNVLYLEVEPKGRLTGKVTGTDGTPAASAKVTAILDTGVSPLAVADQERDQRMGGFGGVWLGGAQAQVTTSTDAEGKFEFEKLGAGRYFVVARSDDGLPAYTGPLEVKPGEAAALAEALRLAPVKGARTKVKLKVLAPDGNPCASSQVYFNFRRCAENTEKEEQQEQDDKEAEAEKLYENWGSEVASPMVTTDDKGVCEAGRLRPGTYYLEVFAQNRIPKYVPEVKISGEELEVEVRFEDKSGTVVGNIPGAQNSYAVRLLPMDRPGAKELLADGERLSTFLFSGSYNPDDIFNWGGMNFVRGMPEVGLSATPDGKGFFRFEKVPPGTYAAVGLRADMSLAVMHGIQVEAGKSAQAPQFPKDTPPVVPEGTQANETQLMYRIKVKVLLPDGQPAANVAVYMASENGSSGTSTNAKGEASTNWYRNTPIEDTRLVIAVAGHEPYVSKLPDTVVGRDPKEARNDEDTPEIVVKLKAMRYGDLKVHVVDETGQPVTGACVAAVAGNVPNFMGNNAPARTAYTTADGVATLRQMAPGKRKFNVWREGYFLAEDDGEAKKEEEKNEAQGINRAPRQLETTVTAGEETTATATMYRALTLEGVARTSDGKPVPSLGLYVSDSTSATALVQTDAEGRFSVSGLRRGRVNVYPQLGSRLVLSTQPEKPKAEDGKIVLVIGSAVPVQLRVQAQDLPQTVSLAEPGSWDPRKEQDGKSSRSGRSYYATVSSEGLAEIDRALPGTYEAILSGRTADPSLGKVRYRRVGRRGYSTTSMQAEIPASRIVPGITVKAAEGGRVETLDLKLEPMSGRLALRVVLDPEQAKVMKRMAQNAYINVTLIGEHAFANGTWNFTDPGESKPAIVAGEGPTPSPRPAGDQRVFTGLPPGTYTVVAKVSGYEKGRIRRGPWVQIASDLLTLGTVEVKGNADADAPPKALELKLPAEFISKFSGAKEGGEGGASEYDDYIGPDYEPPVRP
ncbi:MAG: hypothetical protein L6R28_13820 [Planctomycetes bacterium]|nr:hypothetical protein [Planctomycetota bacterium]